MFVVSISSRRPELLRKYLRGSNVRRDLVKGVLCIESARSLILVLRIIGLGAAVPATR